MNRPEPSRPLRKHNYHNREHAHAHCLPSPLCGHFFVPLPPGVESPPRVSCSTISAKATYTEAASSCQCSGDAPSPLLSGSGPRSTPPGTRVAKQKPQELALSLSASAHECKYIVVATWSNIVTEAPDRAQNRSSGIASTPRSLRRPGCRHGCLGRAWRSFREVSSKD